MLISLVACNNYCYNVEMSEPDLVILNINNSDSILTGIQQGDFNFEIIVGNILDIANECGTKTSTSCELLIELFYSETGGINTFEKVATGIYEIPSLNAGNTYSNNISVTINISGYYYLKAVIDQNMKIIERDETNNKKTIGYKPAYIIYVQENKREKQKNNKSEKYIEIKTNNNLYYFTSKNYNN